MKNKNMLLLKALLLSTSRVNLYRYCKDKKKRKKIVGGFIGVGLLYLMLMAYCVAMCIGYGEYGLAGSMPGMCATMISALAFIFTFIKTNGYLFNFKEYDMLMSLPFKSGSVAACKFMYMYINSMPWYASISVSMLIGYGIYVKPAIYVYPLWIVLSLFLPLIPMLIASFLGFLIARIGSGFRHKTLIQTILTILLVLLIFAARFLIEDVFRNDKVEEIIEVTSGAMDSVSDIYLPAGWFSNAVNNQGISDILLLVGVSILLFAVVFLLVGRSYRSINSKLKSHAASKNFRMKAQKKNSIVKAVAFKEFKRMTGSTVYMTNGILGMVLATIAGVVALVFGYDKISEVMLKATPEGISIIRPAIPFAAYFLVGMYSTTASTPSLEGKNYWIVQSLPIEKKKLYQGKMLFNMCLSVPFMVFTILCFCITTRTPIIESALYLVLGIAMCAFSTAWGCVCGVKHIRLDWENEVEVIKQSSAVAIYMFPNMFAGMALGTLAVVLGTKVEHNLITLGFLLLVGVLAALSYRKVMRLSKKEIF